MSKENNIPAFPQNPDCLAAEEVGMTLRDYFAAKVTPFLLAQEHKPYRDYNYSNAAIGAYAMADAMLEARKK